MRRSQQGFVLVSVLVIAMLVSMIAVSLLFRLRAEETAVAAARGAEQAWAAAQTGIFTAMQIAAAAESGETGWQNDPAKFHQQFVLDDGVDRWYFTVFSPERTGEGEIRYGLTDEASKLNLRQADQEMIGKLPGMSQTLAEAVADFVRTGRGGAGNADEPDGAGWLAEAAPPPRRMTTLDELLLISGLTPQLLYGSQLPASRRRPRTNELVSIEIDPLAQVPLRSYLTWISYDLNRTEEKEPRIDLNDPAADLTGLPEAAAAYVQALHQEQIRIAHPAELLEAKRTFKNENGEDIELESGIAQADLPSLLDRFTATNTVRLEGLINLNTTAAAVLQTLPGIDEALAESIVSAREALSPEARRTPAWIVREGLVDSEAFIPLAPRLTTRSWQYSFHVIGHAFPSARFRVLEVVIDLAGPVPAIVYLRDLTRTGLPFPIREETEATHG